MKGTEEGGESRARQFQTHKKKREYKQVPVEFYIRIDYLRYLKKGKKKKEVLHLRHILYSTVGVNRLQYSVHRV